MFNERKRTNLVTIMLAISMICSSFMGTASAATSSPSDIRGTWAEKMLTEWLAKGWLTGYSDGSVKPKKEVTRAEFFSLANKALGFSEKASISFGDVRPGNWKHDQVAAAVKAGYASGDLTGNIYPDRQVSREEAAVMIAKAFGLDLTQAAAAAFKDAASMSGDGKKAVGALVAKGVLKGYTDGTFKPKRTITREEAVAIIDGALKRLERGSAERKLDQAGTYGPASGTETVAGNVTISAAGVTLRNTTIAGNLLLAEGIGDGDVHLDNVTVKGSTAVRGGGPNSIHLKNSVFATIVVDKKSGLVRIVAEAGTTAKQVNLLSGAKLENGSGKGSAFEAVTLAEALPPGSKVTLIGEFADVNVASKGVAVEVPSGAIDSFNVRSGAEGSTLNLGKDAKVVQLVLDAVLKVLGQGGIEKAVISGAAKDSTFERKPNAQEGSGASSGSGGGGGGGGSPGGDQTPPAAIVVSGVANGGTYLSVTPTWNEVPGTTITARLKKDGEEDLAFVSGTTVSENGQYELTVTVKKTSNGKTAVTKIGFVIDTNLPSPALVTGVEEGGVYAEAVAPAWELAAGTTGTATLSRNGGTPASFESGTGIADNGDYVLSVLIKKTSNGLTAMKTISFTIDASAPDAVVVNGVEEGGTYASATPDWADPAPGSGLRIEASLTKDGVSVADYEKGDTLTEDGDYELTVTVTKPTTGKFAKTVVAFAINSAGAVPPVITGVEDGRTYPVAVTPTVEDEAGMSSSVVLKKDGTVVDYTMGATISEDGEYQLIVTTVNQLNGLRLTTTIDFAIDSVGPEPIEVTGVEDGAEYEDVPVLAYWDDAATGTVITATLRKDGAASVPYEREEAISEDGDYELSVVVMKLSNELVAETTIEFAISTPPAPASIGGVAEGQTYEDAVTPNWTDAEGTTSSAALTKDGSPVAYAKGDAVSEDGSYELVVTTTKTSNGKTATTSVTFEISTPAPDAVVVTGVANGGTYAASVTPNWTDAEGTTSSAALTKDGSPVAYAKGDAVSEDGSYELVVTTTKTSNGKTATTSVTFAIDTAPPEAATVTGVTYGTFRSVTPVWTDAPGTTSEATLNKDDGSPVPYTKGTLVTAEGYYELIVTTTKASNGKTATTTVLFAIDSEAPDIAGVTNGSTYTAPVTPSWTDAPGTTTTAALNKDGSPVGYAKGDEISDVGSYELIVTTTKTNGTTIASVFLFAILP